MEKRDFAEDVCIMEVDNLVKNLRIFLKTANETDKKKYTPIFKCIQDQDFLSFLTNDHRQTLIRIEDNLSRNNSYSITVFQNILANSNLGSIYFISLSYLNDKVKNINHFTTKTNELENKIEEAKNNINKISETADLISGATVLSEYAKNFDKQSKTHSQKSIKWLISLILSIIVFFIILSIIIFLNISEFPIIKSLVADDIKTSTNISLLVIAIKAGLIFAYLQIPNFLKKNYYAEKHLEQACTHRSNVLNSLQAVHNSIQDTVEKDKIITTGAMIAFSEPESGYITRKEGAGSDKITELLIGKLIK